MSQGGYCSLVSAAAATLTALVFLRAAWHKLRDLEFFAALLADYRVVPTWAAGAASRVVVAAEVAVTMSLLVPGLHRAGAALAIVTLLIYGAAMTANIVRGRTQLDCGCGGSPQRLGWLLVVRNLVLTAVAALGLLPSPTGLSTPEAAIAVGSALALWIGFLLVEELLANASRMSGDALEGSS
jgi:Methylamine utilisation protein MauE